MLGVGSYDKQGGTNTFVRGLSKRLSEKGIYTLVVSHKLKGEDFKRREINKNLFVEYFPAFPRKRYFLPLYVLRFFLMAVYLAYYVSKHKIDVILTGETEALPFFICKLFGARVIIRGGNPFPSVTKIEFGRKKRRLNSVVYKLIDVYERIILYLADDIVILSGWEKEILKEYTNKNFKMIRYAVDEEKFKPDKSKKIYDLVYIGRISYSKNIDKLIGIFDGAREKVKVKLFLVGQLEDYQDIKEFTKKSKYEKDIIYLGENKADEIPGILKKSKVFVHAAYDLGNAPLEAASCGLPVVVLGEKFDEDYVLKSKDEKEFSLKIANLIKNREEYLRISKKNREIVMGEHSWKSVSNQYEKLFNEESVYKLDKTYL